MVERVSDLSDDVTLRDLTFEGNVGFPISRIEKIGRVRRLLQEQEEEQPQKEEPALLPPKRPRRERITFTTLHPEMILGDMVMESTRFGPDSACKAREGEDLSQQLANAIQFLQAEIKPYELEELDEGEDHSIPADPTVKNFSYTVVDGQVYYRENSLMHPVEVSVTAENRIRGMIELRECVRRLIEYQTEGYPDEDIAAEQQKLNVLYDSFTAKYGLINSLSLIHI